MEIKTIELKWSENCNIIVGQSHFIKSVEDISEIMSGYVPSAQYGFAFCEASDPCLIRTAGNDEALIKEAADNAFAVAAGHTFYLIMKGCFPINILNQIKNCQEVCRVFCATANPLQVIVASTDQGNGILGVVDGYSPKGVESEEDKISRHELLRKFGYKF
ncbi:MAG TPA: adenosine monophosphate-protein transferase [Lentisphaeria bacterium]|nr:MAG: adenosine monophosphate-protein transferase [Lentisphaerae bacterium GWF2_38_69]HBM14917.1 adenosine monophosphate-protein transferase [Lentisphaeria bacterium]